MNVKCIKPFEDMDAKTDRQVGDVWEVSEERFNEINATQYGTLVEKVSETRKRSTKKADEE